MSPKTPSPSKLEKCMSPTDSDQTTVPKSTKKSKNSSKIEATLSPVKLTGKINTNI